MNWKTLTILTVMSACLGLQQHCQAQHIYVNNITGLDHSNGRSPRFAGGENGPVKTIQAAVRKVQPGWRIVIAKTSQPYRESVVIDGAQVASRPRFPVVIEGNGAELVGFDEVESYRWKYLLDGYFELAEPFRRTGVLLPVEREVERVAVPLFAEVRPELALGQYALWRGRFLLRLAPGSNIKDERFLASREQFGMVIYRAQNVIVRELQIRGFATDAVQVRGPVAGIRFERCRFADNGRAGLAAYNNAVVEVSGSFLTNNAYAGIVAENFSDLTLASCQIEGSANDHVVESANSHIVASGPAPEPLNFEAAAAVEAKAAAAEPARAPDAAPKPPAPKRKTPSFFDNP